MFLYNFISLNEKNTGTLQWKTVGNSECLELSTCANEWNWWDTRMSNTAIEKNMCIQQYFLSTVFIWLINIASTLGLLVTYKPNNTMCLDISFIDIWAIGEI